MESNAADSKKNPKMLLPTLKVECTASFSIHRVLSAIFGLHFMIISQVSTSSVFFLAAALSIFYMLLLNNTLGMRWCSSYNLTLTPTRFLHWVQGVIKWLWLAIKKIYNNNNNERHAYRLTKQISCFCSLCPWSTISQASGHDSQNQFVIFLLQNTNSLPMFFDY